MMEYRQENITESAIVSYLNGEDLPTEVGADVQVWISSPENLKEAREIYQAWELSALAGNIKPDRQKAYSKIKDQLGLPEQKKETPVRKLNTAWWYAAAAVIMLVSVLIFSTPEEQLLVLTPQEQLSHPLEDGSLITIKKNSTIKYLVSSFAQNEVNKRALYLEGESFFEVAHNPLRPFTVKTQDAEITVLGTKFLVRSVEGNPTQVLVTEGQVKVEYLKTGQVVYLSAQEEVSFDQKTTASVAKSDQNRLFWKTGLLNFPGVKLKEVFNTLEKEFNKEIEVQNESILNCEISVTFEKKSLDTIIQVITSTLNLKHEITDTKILISGDGCI